MELLKPYTKNELDLKNHLVMAPMTRSRAIDSIPNDIMAEYYEQRSTAGLIVTEGTAPTPEALGYPRIPGIFTKEQIEGWKKTTSAVHKNKAKIFLQLMHTGRIGHIDNLPTGVDLISPTDKQAAGQMFTDTQGLQEMSTPKAISEQDVKKVIADHVKASQNAMEAGFDGVEIHGANGYLVEQFLNPNVNTRQDSYGGSIEKRSGFAVEMATEISKAIGREKVGIRFSPYNDFNDQPLYDQEEVHKTYLHLAKELEKIGIAYIHIAQTPNSPQKTFEAIRENFSGTIILCNGLTPESAEKQITEGFADLAAFGRSFLSNPDLPLRIEKGTDLNALNPQRLYTPDSKGYTDYPTLNKTI